MNLEYLIGVALAKISEIVLSILYVWFLTSVIAWGFGFAWTITQAMGIVAAIYLVRFTFLPLVKLLRKADE